jgi:aryl-alcohol dehydrogenase-like predicted oxidoreductase
MSNWDDVRLSRRDVLQTALATGIGSTLAGRLLAADFAAGPLITKAIPSTGERIPVVGIGANRFGNIDVSAVRDLLRRMSELGGKMVDTAALYAGSEERIGSALSDMNLRSKLFLVSKMNSVGATNDPPLPPVSTRHGADPVGGIDSFNRSLQRLQTDKIDLMMAHWLSSVDTLMPVLLDLKKQGKVRYIGITTVTPGMHSRIAGYMRKYPVDFVQVEYSMDDRSAEKEVFPVALEKKIAISVARPFGGENSALFGKVAGRKLPDWAAEYGIASWGQFFLKYVISHPAATCVVPGATKIAHLEDNQAAGRGRLPDAAMRAKMEAFWAGLG